MEENDDDREGDLSSIIAFLPLVLRSSQVVEALKALSKGPGHSKVDSGQVLFLAVEDIKQSLNLSNDVSTFSTGDGFSLFFDDETVAGIEKTMGDVKKNSPVKEEIEEYSGDVKSLTKTGLNNDQLEARLFPHHKLLFGFVATSDTKDSDIMGRHKTRIIAIDALTRAGTRQYGHDLLLREVNKAFCGFADPCKPHPYEIFFNGGHLSEAEHDQKLKSLESFEDEVGIVTGNWVCGIFGGDPELKTMLQWLAASQALRPFVVYCTFRLKALQSLDQVTKLITSNGWSVGDLWNKIAEYSSQRSKRKTKGGFFKWLLPRLSSDNP